MEFSQNGFFQTDQFSLNSHLRVIVYTDAAGIGGAEISLSQLVATVSDDIEVTVLGTSELVVEAYESNCFDAITCLSVIEHGVDIRAYFQEMSRLLKPGGILITSTDYYVEPIDCENKVAFGVPVRIFSRSQIQ